MNAAKGLIGDDKRPIYPTDEDDDPHLHTWRPVGLLDGVATPAGWDSRPHVVQSCVCGEVRKVVIP